MGSRVSALVAWMANFGLAPRMIAVVDRVPVNAVSMAVNQCMLIWRWCRKRPDERRGCGKPSSRYENLYLVARSASGGAEEMGGLLGWGGQIWC